MPPGNGTMFADPTTADYALRVSSEAVVIVVQRFHARQQR